MTTLNIAEVFKKFEDAKTKEEKKSVLLKYNTDCLQQVLYYNFNPNVKFYSPNVTPNKYNDNLPGLSYSNIVQEMKRIYLFIKGNPIADKLLPEKRNQLLMQMLESFDPNESKLFIDMMNKNIQIKGLTKSLIKEVFPNLNV